MARRVRVARLYERAEMAIRILSLAVELASLGILCYLSVTFLDDHATNPVAYVGIAIALATNMVGLCSLVKLGVDSRDNSDDSSSRSRDDGPEATRGDESHHSRSRSRQRRQLGFTDRSAQPAWPAWPDNRLPQVGLFWVALGDMASAVLLFFSWIWTVARGMFWSCLVNATTSNDPSSRGASSAAWPSALASVAAAAAVSTVNGTVEPAGDKNNDNTTQLVYANCDGHVPPSDDLQKLSWILPFVMAAMHSTVMLVYCSAMQRRPDRSPRAGTVYA